MARRSRIHIGITGSAALILGLLGSSYTLAQEHRLGYPLPSGAHQSINISPEELARTILDYKEKDTKEIDNGRVHTITKFPRSNQIEKGWPIFWETRYEETGDTRLRLASIRPIELEYRDLEPVGPSPRDTLTSTLERFETLNPAVMDTLTFRDVFEEDGCIPLERTSSHKWRNNATASSGRNIRHHNDMRALTTAMLIAEMYPDLDQSYLRQVRSTQEWIAQ